MIKVAFSCYKFRYQRLLKEYPLHIIYTIQIKMHGWNSDLWEWTNMCAFLSSWNIWWYIDYHSPGAFQKKASILFGIELNDESIADMEKDLKKISGYRDLVSIFYRLFTV